TAKGTKLVGRSKHAVMRFDDPLGAPQAIAKSDRPLSRLGSAPSVVAVWTDDGDTPHLFGVDGGAATLKLPAPPLRSIAFVDAQHGAAVFEAAGLAVTSDGGATWKIPSETG